MRIDVDAEDGSAATGLLALLVTVLELLVETMEREAVRRMEAGDLTDEEIERVGETLQAVEAEIEDIKRREDLTEPTAELRDDLDGLVEQALAQVDDDEVRRYATDFLNGGTEQ